MSSKRKTASKTNAKPKTATAKAKTTAKPKTTKAKTNAKAKTETSKKETAAKTKSTAKNSTDGGLAKAVAVVSEVFRPDAMVSDISAHSSMTFTGTHLRANTFAAAIKFPLKTKFKANVDGGLMAKIVDSFKNSEDDIGVSIDDAVMTIASGKSNVEMVVLSTDADEVADLSGAVEFKVNVETKEKIVEALTQTLRAAGNKDNRYHVNGVHFYVEKGNLIVMACDGFTACRVNTGIKGASKFDGLSLTRETVESFIATANLIECQGDTMLMTLDDEKQPSLFGWRFSNGAEFCASAMDKPKDFKIKELMDKLESYNADKLSSVATPDGLMNAIMEGKVVASKESPVKFSVKDGVMSLKTGDEDKGLLYRTTDIKTEIKDTEVSYKWIYLKRLSKNPSDRILFYKDGPLYFGGVDVYDNDSVGVQTFVMPLLS